MDVEDRRPGLVRDADAELDRLGEDDLFLGREERDARDLAQVEPRRVLDVERILVERLGRLVVCRSRHDGDRDGRDLGLDGRSRELVVRRLRDRIERGHGHQRRLRRLGRLDPVGVIVEKGDQRSTPNGTWTAHGDRRPGADVDVQRPIHPPPRWLSPHAGPASSRTYVVACQVLTRHLSPYPTSNGAFLATPLSILLTSITSSSHGRYQRRARSFWLHRRPGRHPRRGSADPRLRLPGPRTRTGSLFTRASRRSTKARAIATSRRQ